MNVSPYFGQKMLPAHLPRAHQPKAGNCVEVQEAEKTNGLRSTETLLFTHFHIFSSFERTQEACG